MHDDSEPKEEATTEPSKQYGISDPAVLAEWLINWLADWPREQISTTRAQSKYVYSTRIHPSNVSM